MNLRRYFKELQRRHVFKAGIAYLVVAWLVVQVLSILLPAFEASPSFLRVAIIILAIGFPIWLIMAWIYDFTPEGIVKTEELVEESETPQKNKVNYNRVIIGGLLVAVILLLVNTFWNSNEVAQKKEEATFLPNFKSSIAVLAFDDMSPNKDQEYFSDGISEEILNRLAYFKDLKVISRTSSFAYKGQNVPIEQIGEELDVAYVLEGSVRKSGDTYRTTVQLIDTKTGAHIWSANFDRKVQDILLTQDEIAKTVAERLDLTFKNTEVLHRKVDPEAYDLYLKAQHKKEQYTYPTIVAADSLIKQSLELDNQYGPSWLVLAVTTFHRSFNYGLMDKSEGMELVKKYAKKTLELDAENVEALTWLSNVAWNERDFETYQHYLTAVMNSKEISGISLGYSGFCAIRNNRIKEGVRYTEDWAIIDPGNWQPYSLLAESYMTLGDYDHAIEHALNLVNLEDENLDSTYKILVEAYAKKSNFEMAEKYLEKIEGSYYSNYTQCIIEFLKGNNDISKKYLDDLKSLEHPFGVTGWKEFEIATLYALRSENDLAFANIDSNLDFVKSYLDIFFNQGNLKNLHNDPRWDALMDELEEEFNYDFRNIQ